MQLNLLKRDDSELFNRVKKKKATLLSTFTFAVFWQRIYVKSKLEDTIKEHSINSDNCRVMSREGRKGGKKGRERKLPGEQQQAFLTSENNLRFLWPEMVPLTSFGTLKRHSCLGCDSGNSPFKFLPKCFKLP